MTVSDIIYNNVRINYDSYIINIIDNNNSINTGNNTQVQVRNNNATRLWAAINTPPGKPRETTDEICMKTYIGVLVIKSTFCLWFPNLSNTGYTYTVTMATRKVHLSAASIR